MEAAVERTGMYAQRVPRKRILANLRHPGTQILQSGDPFYPCIIKCHDYT